MMQIADPKGSVVKSNPFKNMVSKMILNIDNVVIRQYKVNVLIDEFHRQVKLMYNLETLFLSEHDSIQDNILKKLENRIAIVDGDILYVDDNVLFNEVMLLVFSEGNVSDQEIIGSMIRYINIGG